MPITADTIEQTARLSELSQDDRTLLEDISHLRSLDELTEMVGTLTDEERAILARLDASPEPTEEELNAVDVIFTRRVADETIARVRNSEGPPTKRQRLFLRLRAESLLRSQESLIRQGFTLLELLSDGEASSLLQGISSETLEKTATEVAEGVVGSWRRRVG